MLSVILKFDGETRCSGHPIDFVCGVYLRFLTAGVLTVFIESSWFSTVFL